MTDDSPLRLIRKHLFRVSQDDMALVAGVTRPMISKYESGKSDPPMAVLRRIRTDARERGLAFTGECFFDPAAVLAAERVPEDVQ